MRSMPQLRAGTTVVVENGDDRRAARRPRSTKIEPGAGGHLRSRPRPAPTRRRAMTKITLEGEGPAWLASAAPASLTVHFGSRERRPRRPARQYRDRARDLQPSAGLAGPVEPLQLATQSRVLLQDALELGVDLAGNVTDDGAGIGTLTPLGDAAPFPRPCARRSGLRQPGRVTRGESVEEILGSGDATQSFQRFRLTKKPLTYLPAPGTATGRTARSRSGSPACAGARSRACSWPAPRTRSTRSARRSTARPR